MRRLCSAKRKRCAAAAAGAVRQSEQYRVHRQRHLAALNGGRVPQPHCGARWTARICDPVARASHIRRGEIYDLERRAGVTIGRPQVLLVCRSRQSVRVFFPTRRWGRP